MWHHRAGEWTQHEGRGVGGCRESRSGNVVVVRVVEVLENQERVVVPTTTWSSRTRRTPRSYILREDSTLINDQTQTILALVK